MHVGDHAWIDAPVEEVFAYMDLPENQTEITPSLSTVETVGRLPNGGTRASYTYRMVGIPFDGEVVATEYEPDERVVFEMTGNLEGTIGKIDAGEAFVNVHTVANPGGELAGEIEPRGR
jgi:hypothetical protein